MGDFHLPQESRAVYCSSVRVKQKSHVNECPSRMWLMKYSIEMLFLPLEICQVFVGFGKQSWKKPCFMNCATFCK